jgi:hypothetical protein
VGKGGTFTVDGLPGQAGDRYLVITDYLGVTYSSEVHPPAPANLPIYETTTDDSVLSIPSETLSVLAGKGGTYQVLQLLRVRNSSDRAFIGSAVTGTAGSPQRATLELPIPPGAFNFAPQSGISAPLVAAPDGLVATSDPVLPGDSDLSYLYAVTVPRSGWSMTRPVVYPTARVEVLVEPGLRLSGPGFTFRQRIPIGKRSFRRYEAGAMAPGTTLAAEVTPIGSKAWTLWLGLAAVLAFVLAAAFGIPRLLRRSGDQPAGDQPAGERRRLIEEIAALDEAHEAGGVPDAEYRARRARLKDRLVAGAPDRSAETT